MGGWFTQSSESTVIIRWLLWSSDSKGWLIGKVPDAGKDWGQKKRASEDEMPGCYHQRSGHGLGQTSGDGEGQGGLVCCSPKSHDGMTEHQQHGLNCILQIFQLKPWPQVRWHLQMNLLKRQLGLVRVGLGHSWWD